MIKVSIIIPTLNHLEDCLKPCINAIKKYINLEDKEVIIAANGCTDGTREYVESLGEPFKLLWWDKPMGFAVPNNEAAKIAKGEYLLFLNNDAFFTASWPIDRLLSEFEKNPRLGIAGAQMRHNMETDRDFVIFYCAMMKKELFEKFGMFDEVFADGTCEDVDLCIKVSNAGYDLKSIALPVTHKGGTTIVQMSNMMERLNRNALILGKKWDSKWYRDLMDKKSSGKIKVSIVIGTLNHLDDCLKPCCETIQKYCNLEDKEVIIVANGCTDGTREYVESLGEPFKLLWYDNPLGYSKANNEGIKIAKGEYILLLNNDCFFLDQAKDTAINMLLEPFERNSKVGITGPSLSVSPAIQREFIIFFCAMIKRELFDKIGLLDEAFGKGAGEDTDFCIKAVSLGYELAVAGQMTDRGPEGIIGSVPVWHRGEATVHDFPDWTEHFDRNTKILIDRYPNNQIRLGNDGERFVAGKNDALLPREKARYEWAAKNLVGKKILDIGCSSGYGVRLLPKNIEYVGVDYDTKIIEFAKENFGDENHNFICADINDFITTCDQYDTIIAFEILEHLENGKELAQELKKHCKCLLASAPFNETRHSEHHKLFGLNKDDFKDFNYYLMLDKGQIVGMNDSSWGLMLMKWPVRPSVLCCIPTKGRYFTTLPLAIASVISQTRKPDKLIIYDDGEHKDLREFSIYQYFFKNLDAVDIKWEVSFTNGVGQHHAHQKANTSDFDYVWRLDDDTIANPDVLEKLLSHMKDDVGAVAGSVVTPGGEAYHDWYALNLLDITRAPNIQWCRGTGVVEVEHLYSSFLYRTNIVDYCLELSQVAHREETIFSHRLFQAGYKLLVDRSAITWHYRNPEGGIRTQDDSTLWEHDEEIFRKELAKWGYKMIALLHGLGDHLMFVNIIPRLLEQHKKLVIFCTSMEAFENLPNVIVKPLSEAAAWGVKETGIYEWMSKYNWKRSMLEAYEKLYLD